MGLLAACVLALATIPFSLRGVTHDDQESLIPEFYIKFKGTGSGTTKMTVTFERFPDYDSSGNRVTYSVTTGEMTGSSSTWTTTSLLVPKGLPLDMVGSLKITGQYVAEYQIFLNPPDTKYQPFVGTTERYLIQWGNIAGADALPHEYSVWFKRAGDSGGKAGSASSAMPGWKNFKLNLGYGKTGKPLSSILFWGGREAALVNDSMELELRDYTLDGKSHTQFWTPAMTYDFVTDEAYSEVGFGDGAYVVSGYDNATQPGLLVTDGSGKSYRSYQEGMAPVIKYVLNYATSTAAGNTTARTHIRRQEGSLEMVSDAYLQSSTDSGSFVYVPGHTIYIPAMPPFPERQYTTPGYTVCVRAPQGTLKNYSYDWVDYGSIGNRLCRSTEETITAHWWNELDRTVSSSVGMGVGGEFSMSGVASGRCETSPNKQDLPGDLYFWPSVTLHGDSTTSTPGNFNGNAEYYWLANSGSHLKLKYQIEPTGAWTYYEYYDDFESRGMVKTITKPYLTDPATPTPPANGTMVTEITYDAAWDGSKTLPATVVTKLKGSSTAEDKVISRTAYSYATENYGGSSVPVLWVTTKDDYYGPGPNDKTTTISKRFRPDVHRVLANLPVSETHADGTKIVWNYEAGTYDEGTKGFTVYANPNPAVALGTSGSQSEVAVREWKFSCYPSSAAGAVSLGLDGSHVVPNKSTAELRTRDKFGRLRRVDTLVCSGANASGPLWETLTSEVHYYDQGGNLILTERLMDGGAQPDWVEVYEAQYTDRNGTSEDYASISLDNSTSEYVRYTGRKQYEKDRSGVIKKFFYDEYGRVSRVVTLQPPAVSSTFSSPPASQTSYTYDADNRILSTAIGMQTGNLAAGNSWANDRNYCVLAGFNVGQSYTYTAGNSIYLSAAANEAETAPAGSTIAPGTFTATQSSYYIWWTGSGDAGTPLTAVLQLTAPQSCEQLISQTTYNLAGLPTSEVSPGGYTTTTSYGDIASRKITRTLLGRDDPSYNRTIVNETYLDGRPKATYSTGTYKSEAVVPQFHDYSVVENGNVTIGTTTMKAGIPRTVTSTGNYQAHTSRKVTRDSDWLGRVVKETSANPSDVGDLTTEYAYNSLGQLKKTVIGGLAPVLYEYDACGQLWRSGIKLETTTPNSLVPASKDRISEQETFFQKIEGTWYEKTVNKTYHNESTAPDAATPLTVQTTLAQRGHWAVYDVFPEPEYEYLLPLESVTIAFDSLGNCTWTESYVDRSCAFGWTKDFASTRTLNGDAMSVNGRVVYQYNVADNTSTYWSYDAYGRVTDTSGRAGTTSLTYRPGSTEVIWQRAPDNTWTRTDYDPAGRVKVVTNFVAASATQPNPAAGAIGKATRYAYNKRGQVTHVWGDVPHPVQYTYYSDPSQKELEGALYEELTYNGGSSWNQETWPTSPGTANKTVFEYFLQNGLLKTKKHWTVVGSTYQAVNYEFNKRGDLTKRKWQRDGTLKETGYVYKDNEADGANTGELTKVDYATVASDPGHTPDVVYTYNRIGALATVTDAAGTRTFNYRASDLQLESQNLPSTLYGNGRRLVVTYDDFGRNGGYWYDAAQAGETVYATYSYDAAKGWLETITTPVGAYTYTYDYDASRGGSPLVATITGPTVNGLVFNQARTYAPNSLLLNSWTTRLGIPETGATDLAAYGFRYDGQHRITKLAQSGKIYQADSYGTGLTLDMAYNDRNELSGVTTYRTANPDTINPSITPKLPRRNFSFTYDTMGNRLTAKVDSDNNGSGWGYVPNILGQYASRVNPPFVEVNGLVDQRVATVVATLNGSGFNELTRLPLCTDAGCLDYFYGKGSRTASSQTKIETIDLRLTSDVGRTRIDTRRVLALAQNESFTYDNDGNLTSDAAWQYTYDAENRVKEIQTLPGLLTTIGIDSVRLRFTYDYLGRRVKKEVFRFTGDTASPWPTTSRTTYIYLYDGLNLIAEFMDNGSALLLMKSYYWGLDLSGSLQGAGGVGGLLGIQTHYSGGKTCAAINDCNGNVVGLMDLNPIRAGLLVAEYEYSPFGEPVRAMGSLASVNPWRFSTKYWDEETKLLNFGYRYYSPSLGRFLNRDPKDELGRLQLSAPLGGGGVVAWSYIGMLVGTPGKSPGLTPGTPAGLAQSNERQDAGYRNSTQPGNIFAHRKGSPSRGGGGGSMARPYQRPPSAGANHSYGFVNNSPYMAIDPLGLIYGEFMNWMFGTSFNDYFAVDIGSYAVPGDFSGGWGFSSPSPALDWGGMGSGSQGVPIVFSPMMTPEHSTFDYSGHFFSELRDTMRLQDAMCGKIGWDQVPNLGEQGVEAAWTVVDMALTLSGLFELRTASLLSIELQVGRQFERGSLYAAESRAAQFTFRGDARAPSTIFEQGFQARGTSTDLLAHALDNTRPPSAFISTSRSAEMAGSFADNIYVVRPRGGIDVNQVLGPRSPFPSELEIAVPYRIFPSDVRAVTLPQEGMSILNPNWYGR